MWRSSPASRQLFGALLGGSSARTRCGCADRLVRPWSYPFSASPTASPSPPPPRATPESGVGGGAAAGGSGAPPTAAAAAARGEAEALSFSEARKLLRLVNVEALKRKLGMDGEEVIGYVDLVEACLHMGVARTREEAGEFARVLDEAGVVLLFRDKVYLHPDKVVDLMKTAVPLALAPENDPRREELKHLSKRKEEIDMLAHKQVRRILWSGLGFFVVQVGLFFRLTFWEFSWDVMEPIAFFSTTTGLVVGYAYFLFTSKDPTYQDLMKRLFLSRQRKLFQKHNFDANRFTELQKCCKCPLDANAVVGIGGFHRD
ncbi:hypothetical protein Taro_028229 [Colocasia esculenta]|uniref:Calcium uniporter protein C-terminal domain-containing protein n=1 Tax=Colocasia esculenta TaxID=4460 RepID=A0A843VWN2_COLES|nr:hypothetical protein [Colocasia esculenta]